MEATDKEKGTSTLNIYMIAVAFTMCIGFLLLSTRSTKIARENEENGRIHTRASRASGAYMTITLVLVFIVLGLVENMN